MSRRLVASGLDALESARQIVEFAGPVRGTTNVGQEYVLVPGSVDRYSGDVILGQAAGGVYYLRGENLYAVFPADTYLHGHQHGQIYGRAYEATSWIIPAATIVMAFVMGMAAGVFGLAATVATVGVLVAKVTVFYISNQERVDEAADHLDEAIEVLAWFHDNCPISFRQFGKVLERAVWEALKSVPEGVSGADVAAVVGRFIGGLAAAPEAGLRPLLTVLSKCMITFAARLPAMAASGAAARAREAGQIFVDSLIEQGVNVPSPEVRAILGEFQQHPEAEAKLRELKDALDNAAPVLSALAESFRTEQAPGRIAPETP